MRHPKLHVLVFVAITVALVSVQAEDQSRQGDGSAALQDQSAAIERAMLYIEGSGTHQELSTKISAVRIDETETRSGVLPFSFKPESGIWRVDFEDLRLDIKGSDSNSVPFPVSVYLDEQTGKLLRIESTARKPSRDTTGRGALEHRLLTRSIKYRGLPDPIPAGFLTVMQKCPFQPFRAERLSAIYVMDSLVSKGKVTPIWVLSLIGIPEIPLSYPKGVAPGKHLAADYIRVTADWMTGKTLEAGN